MLHYWATALSSLRHTSKDMYFYTFTVLSSSSASSDYSAWWGATPKIPYPVLDGQKQLQVWHTGHIKFIEAGSIRLYQSKCFCSQVLQCLLKESCCYYNHQAQVGLLPLYRHEICTGKNPGDPRVNSPVHPSKCVIFIFTYSRIVFLSSLTCTHFNYTRPPLKLSKIYVIYIILITFYLSNTEPAHIEI